MIVASRTRRNGGEVGSLAHNTKNEVPTSIFLFFKQACLRSHMYDALQTSVSSSSLHTQMETHAHTHDDLWIIYILPPPTPVLAGVERELVTRLSHAHGVEFRLKRAS